MAHVIAYRVLVLSGFSDRVDLGVHQRAVDYTITRTRFGTVGSRRRNYSSARLDIDWGLQTLHYF